VVGMGQSNSLLPWINKGPATVAVIGDLILDEYLDGVVNRISPEAPVPVHLVTDTIVTAGGAANVARNVKLAGGEVKLLGVCGNDAAGQSLKQILERDGISTQNILAVNDRPTIKKTRITSQNHQLVRIDWESVTPVASKDWQKLLETLSSIAADVLLISDYGKGGLPPEFLKAAIALAEKMKIPSIIDPKGRDYRRYQGAFAITPNRREACEALGLDPNHEWDYTDLAVRLQKEYQLRHVIITLGPQGMFFLPAPEAKNLKALHLPSRAREVFDVSGAGDTAAAILALALGAKTSFDDAMKLANAAAGRVVEKWGTQPILRAELEEAMQEEEAPTSFRSSASKIVTQQQLKALLGDKGRRAKKMVFTNGCFDLLHVGHVTYLEQARALGDLLVLGLNSDKSIKAIKGPKRPLLPEDARARVLAGLACIDYVVIFDEDTPSNLIEYLLPDILVKGADWATDKIAGAEAVKKAGGDVKNIELVPGISTTEIIRRAKES